MSEPNVVYANVPVNKLVESPLNYRRHFDEAKLTQLAANVKLIGVRSPLLVRALKKGSPWLDATADLLTADAFEIASGHRRYRAAKMAGIENVPAVIQSMTDDAFIETLSVEILQHEDVHALDEAAAYRDLLKRPGYDAHVISARTGKEVPYVQRRLSLLRLITEAQKAFMDGSINLAMALIVARLTVEDQRAALKRLLSTDSWSGIRSSRQLQKWVTEDLMLPLGKAPFDTDDPDLVPVAGSCKECSKRTGYMPDLFPDIEAKDTCTDHRCYGAKKSAFLLVKIRQIAADAKGAEPVLVSRSYEGAKPEPYAGRPVIAKGRYTEVKKSKKPACEFQKTAVVVRGAEEVGATIEICTNPRCPVHAGSSRQIANASPKELAAREKEEFEEKVESSLRLALIDRTMRKFDSQKMMVEDFRLLAVLAFARFAQGDARKAMSKARTGKEEAYLQEGSALRAWIGRKTLADLEQLIFEAALYDGLDFYPEEEDDPDELLLAAKRWGVDVDALRREIEADLRGQQRIAAAQAAQRLAEKEKKAARRKDVVVGSREEAVSAV